MKLFKTQTEQQIVMKYLELLSGSSGGKLSVQSVCQNCFVSRRTFYNYFETLEQLTDKAISFLFLPDGIPPSDLFNLLTRLVSQRTIVKKLMAAHFQRRIHVRLTHLIAVFDTPAPRHTDRHILYSGLAHMILEWLCGDSGASIGAMAKLCGAILSMPD